MNVSYEQLAVFAQQGGLVYFFLLFLAVIVYALWPRNKAGFDAAAQIPLRED
jgi:cytochrome c oxidase cbb3-type subunit IV